MTPVAAALMWNPACGREIQLNIWIGMTVNGECSHSKLMNGGSAVIGGGGFALAALLTAPQRAAAR